MIWRFDYLGLAEETKPEEVVNGSTYYTVDTHELYIYYKGTWYNQNETDDTTDETDDTTDESDDTSDERSESVR